MSRGSPLTPGHLFHRRMADLAASKEQRTYGHVRDRVLAMKDADASSDNAPSAYWQAELRWFEYMLDAGPLVIERLRWHTHHITGIKGYDYGEHRDSSRLGARLEALLIRAEENSDADLFVPEHPALGGFGFRDQAGRLFNVDTLKFFETLIALSRAGVLAAFRDPAGERRVVWEIGAGWGGFAYQFKTLCPNTTYLIVDLPELFLFSAVYLQTVFPEARMRFYTEVEDASLLDDLENIDFVFIPHTQLDLVRPPRCDLTVNMVSFQEMTTAQVRAYTEHAFELGSPFLYSLNRERSRYNPELEGVSRILAERYRLDEVEVLPTDYVTPSKPSKTAKRGNGARANPLTRLLSRRPVATPSKTRDKLSYQHLIGRLSPEHRA